MAIASDVLMGELLEQWPSAGLTLFARYGIGSREKLGFRPQQSLMSVLRQYLVFDVEGVLKTLQQAELQQRALRIEPARFAAAMASPGACLVDCRSGAEFLRWTLPGACLLEAPLVERLRQGSSGPLLLFDHRGPMAGAAALHLARLGLQPQVLDGGLRRWVAEIDDRLPHYGADAPPESRVRQLADPGQMRFRLAPAARPVEGDPRRVPFPCRRLWWRGTDLCVLGEEADWAASLPNVLEWIARGGPEAHPWQPQAEPDWELRLGRALSERVQPTLESHRGTVELVEHQQGVVRLRLGGGCQGCSSAAITVGEEIARTLWEEIPEIVAIEDASDHQDPQAQPHH